MPESQSRRIRNVVRGVEDAALAFRAASDIEERVQSHVERILGKKLVGLRDLSLGTVFDTPGLFVEEVVSPLYRATNSSQSTIDGLIDRWKDGERFLIVAPPGAGKSVLAAYALRKIWSEVSKDLSLLPVLVDLKERRDWVSTEATTWKGFSQVLAATLEVDEESFERLEPRYCLILDSIDEGLIGRNLSEVNELVSTALFRNAHFAFARQQFFDQYLSNSPLLDGRTVVQLGQWSVNQRVTYINCILPILDPSRGVELARGLAAMVAAPGSVATLLDLPLRVNMAVSLVRVGSMEPSEFATLNILELFEEFATQTIEVDVLRRDPAASSVEIHSMLEALAWAEYEGTVEGEDTAAVGLEAEYALDLICGVSSALSRGDGRRLLEYFTNSALMETKHRGVRIGRPVVAFTHRSIQEFFVASKTQNALLESSEALVSLLSIMLTPEIWEFLKEAIDRINRSGRDRSRAVSTMRRAIELLDLTEESNLDEARSRVAREQLYYYLGNIKSREARSFLKTALESIEDAWVRRGIVVGMAFGGETAPLDDYIEGMRLERASGLMPLNSANIGCHLSMFGDQVFDSHSPDVDRGHPDVEKTVRRLIYQLGTSTNEPNWRIDLYSLLTILMYRDVSMNSARSVAKECTDQLERVVSTFERDPAASNWPETAELRQYLTNLKAE